MARGAELAQFAGLFDLAQYVFEQVALGVGVGLVQPQFVDFVDDLSEDGGFVDGQAGAIHEVDRAAPGNVGVQHVHRHQDLREFFPLEALDLGQAVHRVVAAHARYHIIGVAHFRRGLLVGA